MTFCLFHLVTDVEVNKLILQAIEIQKSVIRITVYFIPVTCLMISSLSTGHHGGMCVFPSAVILPSSLRTLSERFPTHSATLSNASPSLPTKFLILPQFLPLSFSTLSPVFASWVSLKVRLLRFR